MRLIFDRDTDELRQSLEQPDDSFRFPLFSELKAEGHSAYLALPLTFTDGKTHGTTWTTDRAGGFR